MNSPAIERLLDATSNLVSEASCLGNELESLNKKKRVATLADLDCIDEARNAVAAVRDEMEERETPDNGRGIRERAALLVLESRAVPETANNWWFYERTKLAEAIRLLPPSARKRPPDERP